MNGVVRRLWGNMSVRWGGVAARADVRVLDLVDVGVAEYRERKYKFAIHVLQQVLHEGPDDWRARLYLGMSYMHAGVPLLALSHFRNLKAICLDRTILIKVETALAVINQRSTVRGLSPK